MTITIPQQLNGWRFIKLRARDKIPIEPKWTTTATYGYSDSGLLAHIEAGGNYGVLGSEDHVIVDGDTPEIQQAVEGHLPLTFTVRTPGRQGRHYYFLCKLKKPFRLRNKDKVIIGDVQGLGKQVVGPSCIHPNGGTYEIVNDRPPNWIAPDDLKRALKEFIIKEPPVEKFATSEREAFQDEGIGASMKITDVHPLEGMMRRGDEYEGPHPVHGSVRGHNFSINPRKNVWICRKHDTGGGPPSLLAVKEGIISCEEATEGALRGETFKKVLELARSKGLLEQASNPRFLYFTEKGTFVPKLLADAITKDTHFATHRVSWVIHRYVDGWYQPDGEALIRELCREKLGKLAKTNYRNEVVQHIQDTTFHKPDDFNAPMNLICLKNGILDLGTLELSEHAPNPIFLNQLPVVFVPDAKCPKIMKFISEILQPEDIPLIQEIIGYCLLRDYRFAVAVMMLGSGANGKSTLLRLIVALVGDQNVATPSLHDLLINRFAKADLYGKLVNIHADIPTKQLWNTGVFKMLTGQDLIWGEKKHITAFTFRNYAKLLYSTNELPKTDDRSAAFWRRWIIVKFLNVFPDGNPRTNPNILDELTTPEELSGLLNWALEGLKRLVKNGQITTTRPREEVETEWITQTDSLRAFVMKCMETAHDCFVAKPDFYAAYQEFCADMDVPSEAAQAVGHRLPTITPGVVGHPRVSIDGKQVRVWKGIRFKTDSPRGLTYSFKGDDIIKVGEPVIERIDKRSKEHRAIGLEPFIAQTKTDEVPEPTVQDIIEVIRSFVGATVAKAKIAEKAGITLERLDTVLEELKQHRKVIDRGAFVEVVE